MTWNRPINDDLIRLKTLRDTLDDLRARSDETGPEMDFLINSLEGEIRVISQNIDQLVPELIKRGGRI